MGQNDRRIFRTILKYIGWTTGIAAMLVFILAATTFLWNNEHNMEHFTAPAGKVLCPEKTQCHFVVLGDLVVNTSIFSTVYDAAKKSDPDFVLLLGDITSRHNQQIFNVSSRQLKKILKETLVCAIPGNHDVSEDRADHDHLRHYRTLFGPGSYFFSYGDTIFYGFDNSLITYSDEDLKQLHDTLEKFRPLYRNFVFFMHVPPSAALQQQQQQRQREIMNQTDSDRLEKVLAKFHPTVVFCGHLHYFLQTNFAGAPLYVVRASGQGSQWGYLDVTIADGKADVRDVAVPWSGKRITLFPDYEEFKLVQITTDQNFIIIGGALLLAALLCAAVAKSIKE